jgi:hypothetical protein
MTPIKDEPEPVGASQELAETHQYLFSLGVDPSVADAAFELSQQLLEKVALTAMTGQGTPIPPGRGQYIWRYSGDGAANEPWDPNPHIAGLDTWFISLGRDDVAGNTVQGCCFLQWDLGRRASKLQFDVRQMDSKRIRVHHVEVATKRLEAIVRTWEGTRELEAGVMVHVREERHTGLRAFMDSLACEVDQLYRTAQKKRRDEILAFTGGAECDVIKWAMVHSAPGEIIRRLRTADIAIELSHLEPWRMYEEKPGGVEFDPSCVLGAVAIAAVGHGKLARKELVAMGLPCAIVYRGDVAIPHFLNLDATRSRYRSEQAQERAASAYRQKYHGEEPDGADPFPPVDV